MNFVRSAALFVLCILFHAGCATQTFSPDEAPEMVVVRDHAGFFRLGPIQSRGPDLSLRVNQRLKLLRKEMGYSFVMLENERTGYVANEYLAPAPPRPPQADSNDAESSSSERSPRRSGGRSYRGPQVNDSPLPEPLPASALDLNIGPEDVMPMPPDPDPEPAVPPAFRY